MAKHSRPLRRARQRTLGVRRWEGIPIAHPRCIATCEAPWQQYEDDLRPITPSNMFKKLFFKSDEKICQKFHLASQSKRLKRFRKWKTELRNKQSSKTKDDKLNIFCEYFWFCWNSSQLKWFHLFLSQNVNGFSLSVASCDCSPQIA